MIGVTDGDRERVVENRDSFVETDLVLTVVLSRLLFIPFKAQSHGDAP
jgi:hypothetical protein